MERGDDGNDETIKGLEGIKKIREQGKNMKEKLEGIERAREEMESGKRVD